MTSSPLASSAIARLAAAALLAYAYFYTAGGWNQNTRFALVRAIVEQGTLRIDDTGMWNGKPVTQDFSRRAGHMYSDKGPGTALAAVPFAALAQPLVATMETPRRVALLSSLVTIAVAAVPTTCTLVLLWWIAVRLGASPAGGLVAAAAFSLASPAFAYATILFGHALATACLFAAFAAAIAVRGADSAKRGFLLGLAVGAGGGWAAVTELPAAVPAAAIALMALWNARGERRVATTVAAGVAVAAAACMAVLLAYNHAAFGSMLSVGYQHVVGFTGMRQGFLGLTYPRAAALHGILFSTYRGLFFFAPALLLGVWGFGAMLRREHARGPAVVALVVALYYVLFNASYFYWDGGSCYGPRQMAGALPFLALPLAFLWDASGRWRRGAVVAAVAWGFALAFAMVAVNPQPPKRFKNPVVEVAWSNLARGNVSANYQGFLEASVLSRRNPEVHARNVGERLGLEGRASLLPLVAAWLAIAATSLRSRRPLRERRPCPPPESP